MAKVWIFCPFPNEVVSAICCLPASCWRVKSAGGLVCVWSLSAVPGGWEPFPRPGVNQAPQEHQLSSHPISSVYRHCRECFHGMWRSCSLLSSNFPLLHRRGDAVVDFDVSLWWMENPRSQWPGAEVAVARPPAYETASPATLLSLLLRSSLYHRSNRFYPVLEQAVSDLGVRR